MIEFKNIELLFILLFIIPMIFMIKKRKFDIDKIFNSEILQKLKLRNQSGIPKKVRAYFLILSFIFMVVAFARPYINNGEIKVKSSFINMVVAIDMSRSMFANDIYPNRFEFAKKKFLDMLENLENIKVSLIGFSNQTFLISPLTQDFHSLKFLTENLSIDNINLKGTNIVNTLETANELLENQEKKILLLLTDGSDKKDFINELEYAKKNNITIYIYNIGSKKGGIIDTQNGALKDKNGNIVVVQRNENIKPLALNSGGAYMNQTLKKDDIKMLISEIQSHFKAKGDEINSIKDTKELFIIPLGMALIFLIIGLFSLPKFKGQK
jgi:Ca-activated chloride channel family protein